MDGTLTREEHVTLRDPRRGSISSAQSYTPGCEASKSWSSYHDRQRSTTLSVSSHTSNTPIRLYVVP